MKRKHVIMCIVAAMASAMLFGCGSSKNVSYTDGTYTGQSQVHEGESIDDDSSGSAGDGYGVVEITITDGKISDCTYQTYETDGTLKDSEYGKKSGEVANQDYYNKAQKAVAACEEYANNLVANGSLDGIDAISGATINYEEFCEAVEDALSQAEAE